MSRDIGPLRGSVRARRRLPYSRVLPLLVAFVGFLGVSEAQVGSLRFPDSGPRLDSRARVGVLQVEPSFDLDGVLPGELLARGGTAAIPEATWRPDLVPSAGFEFETQVVRSIPTVWSMRLDDLDSIAELDVRCDVTGADGQAGALTNTTDPASMIRVWVRPLAPRVVAGATADVIVEGGVVLDMDLRDVRTAGPHVGTLTVTVEHF